MAGALALALALQNKSKINKCAHSPRRHFPKRVTGVEFLDEGALICFVTPPLLIAPLVEQRHYHRE
jgi:hypothetical protein